MAALSANYTLPKISEAPDALKIPGLPLMAPRRPILSHSSVDRQRNDCVGRHRIPFQHWVADTIPAPTAGQPPARPTRLLPGLATRQCGLAVK